MNEISLATPEIAESRSRRIPAGEGELWLALRSEALRAGIREPILRGFLDLAVLDHDGFNSALGALLARKLDAPSLPAERLGDIARAAMAEDPAIIAVAVADLVAIRARDPAAETHLTPFLYYKGFHALEWHRIGHWLWREDRRDLARVDCSYAAREPRDVTRRRSVIRVVGIDRRVGVREARASKRVAVAVRVRAEVPSKCGTHAEEVRGLVRLGWRGRRACGCGGP